MAGFMQDVRSPIAALWWVSVAFGLLVVAGALLAITDARMLPQGENVWLKPIRFALAFAVHGVTLVWIARLTNRVGLQDSAFAMSIWLQVVVMVIEFACVVIQAVRGVPSHFNYATEFDRLIFTIMGIGTIGLFLGFVLILAGLLWRPGPANATANVAMAMVFAVLGSLAGVAMVMPDAAQAAMLEAGTRPAVIGGHAVGAPSDARIPFFGWDAMAGDWRVLHFMGLHAMQLFPLLAWLGGEGLQRQRNVALALVTTGYALLLGLMLWQTTNARSFFAPEPSDLPVLLTSVVIILAGFAVAARAARQAPPLPKK
jgi:hypothetical protein